MKKNKEECKEEEKEKENKLSINSTNYKNSCIILNKIFNLILTNNYSQNFSY